MADLIEVEERREKVVLFAAARAAGDGTEDSLDELAELCDTAGAEVVGRLIQNLDSVSSATYLGKGKRTASSAMTSFPRHSCEIWRMRWA